MRLLKKLSDFTLIRVLVTAVYLCSICFIIAAGVLLLSTRLTTWSLCHGAIILCLVFYVGEKVFMYLYLVERAHKIGGVKRAKDPIFLTGTFIIFCGFGTIAGIAFWQPVAEISKLDQKCRIGLPLIVTIPLLSYDILINIAVTSVFVYYSLGVLKGSRTHGIIRRALPIPCIKSKVRLTDQPKVLELFVVKSLIGCVAVIIPTLANLVVLFKVHGHEQGWLCFTICTIDCMYCPTPSSLYSADWTHSDLGMYLHPLAHRLQDEKAGSRVGGRRLDRNGLGHQWERTKMGKWMGRCLLAFRPLGSLWVVFYGDGHWAQKPYPRM